MVDIVNNVFKNKQFSDWVFEIYGNGNFLEKTLKTIENNNQIFYKGSTDRPDEVLKTGSINLNTSIFEGFSLSILEAAAYGVPTIAFNFGESSYEEIIDGKTGVVIENDNSEEYQKALEKLMTTPEILSKMSAEAYDFSKKFTAETIADQWITLFEEVDRSCRK